MSKTIFERSLYWLKILKDRGTQAEINLNGNGESMLDPDLFNRIVSIKEIMHGYAPVQFCTNGSMISDETAKNLKRAGIDRVDISAHSPSIARKAIHKLQAAGIGGVVNYGAIHKSHNWAGQLEPEHQIPRIQTQICFPLLEGRGYIQSDGNVSPCCYDFKNLGTFGHVSNDDLDQQPIYAYELCKTCHQKIPAAFRSIVNA